MFGPAFNDTGEKFVTGIAENRKTAAPALVRAHLMESLRTALRTNGLGSADAPVELMEDKGLAHDHIRLAGTGLIARLPKQSQMGLPAVENLAYQAACYERASASGHAPRLAAIISVCDALPRGGLLVEEIAGRPARLPDDLPAIATALARIHSLPIPPATQRPPLGDPEDPLRLLLGEITAQAAYLGAAGLVRETQDLIEAGIADLAKFCAAPARPPKRLISFDAHPGNFLIRRDGKAVLVDLEKCRYSAPPLDLAHATLYTSTTWDIASFAVLSPEDVAYAYGLWEQNFDGDAWIFKPWFVPLRRAMWLWSMTWCAKWRAVSDRPVSATADGEDWSMHNSEDALVRHVRNRVDDYLAPSTAGRVAAEFPLLEAIMSTSTRTTRNRS